jgi:hypothetical protein
LAKSDQNKMAFKSDTKRKEDKRDEGSCTTDQKGDGGKERCSNEARTGMDAKSIKT